jgi:hypothetical protein
VDAAGDDAEAGGGVGSPEPRRDQSDPATPLILSLPKIPDEDRSINELCAFWSAQGRIVDCDSTRVARRLLRRLPAKIFGIALIVTGSRCSELRLDCPAVGYYSIIPIARESHIPHHIMDFWIEIGRRTIMGDKK